MQKDKFRVLCFLKGGVILFWAVWFSIAFSSNLCDFLKAFNLLPPSWLFASHNYALIQGVVSIYHLPIDIVTFMFVGILGLEFVICLCFWIALFSYRNGLGWVNKAFTLGVSLWALFLISEEIFIAYQFETGHLILFIAQLVSLIAIHYLLPDRHCERSETI